jgi:hypothetical protein
MDTKTITPDFKLAAFEQTEYWDKEITDEVGRIWVVAIYDNSRHTHLCEFTPSFELHPMYTYTENRASDYTEGEINTWKDRDVFYVHTHDVKPLCNVGNIFVDIEGVQFADPEIESEYDETLQDYIAESTCNGEPLWYEDGKWHVDSAYELAA